MKRVEKTQNLKISRLFIKQIDYQGTSNPQECETRQEVKWTTPLTSSELINIGRKSTTTTNIKKKKKFKTCVKKKKKDKIF